MKKEEFKSKSIEYINKLIDEWFDTNSLQDNLARSFAKTFVKANQNKYDNIIDMVTDEKGNVLIDDLLNNFNIGHNIEMDLSKYGSWMPNKILLLTQNDIEEFKKILHK